MGVTDRAGFVVKDKEASDVGRFLNRILGLSVEKQNLVSAKTLIRFDNFMYPSFRSLNALLPSLFVVILILLRVFKCRSRNCKARRKVSVCFTLPMTSPHPPSLHTAHTETH